MLRKRKYSAENSTRAAALRTATYRAALFAFGTALLFAVLWLCVRNMGERRYDPWQNAINNVRSQSG